MDVALPPAQGFYKLVFCAGTALQSLQLGATSGTYLDGVMKGMDLRLSAEHSRISMDTTSGGFWKIRQVLDVVCL